ncbi:MAG: hypothetical protein P8X73_02525 [Ignavibacteriaceae bacterium]
MRLSFASFFITIVLFAVSCDNVENLLNGTEDGKITAKEKLDDVLRTARTDFSADAMLAAIYGREVNTNGEIDLLQTNSFNAFVYIMQSDVQQSNEFYVPVFGAGPVKSPVNFNTMLSFVKNATAKNIMSAVFGTLSTSSIDPAANYSDSPEVLELLFRRNDVNNFRTINPTSRIDMFLVPSKSIDSISIVNSADWIVNFYGDNTSLVLWINSASGEVKNIAEL